MKGRQVPRRRRIEAWLLRGLDMDLCGACVLAVLGARVSRGTSMRLHLCSFLSRLERRQAGGANVGICVRMVAVLHPTSLYEWTVTRMYWLVRSMQMMPR